MTMLRFGKQICIVRVALLILLLLDSVEMFSIRTTTAFRRTRLMLLSSSTTTRDQSAASKTRPSFQMPNSTPDDSAVAEQKITWNSLGVVKELQHSLERHHQSIVQPTAVQSLIIPILAKNETQYVCFLAATGSGKTLAYTLPLMQNLKRDEADGIVDRLAKRPRAIILAPTRELVTQITTVIKTLSHDYKLSVQGVTGHESPKKLQRPIDILVSTPGRLTHLIQDKGLVVSNRYLKYVILDEMDTMLEQGFERDLQRILYPVLYHTLSPQSETPSPVESAPSLWMTSASSTNAILRMTQQENTKQFAARQHFKKRENAVDASKPNQDATMRLPKMTVLTAPGLHRVVPRLSQTFVDVGNSDKLNVLVDLLSSKRNVPTMIFCNTAKSCVAASHALSEAGLDNLSYNGELKSDLRRDNLESFRQNGGLLVCTDLASRGLDLPHVEQIVMFDFPLNTLDYLHRCGRTARAERAGKVTALVSKRDKVLATAIQNAVQNGEALDGLSSRRTDYLPGGRLFDQNRRHSSPGMAQARTPRRSGSKQQRGGRNNPSSSRTSRTGSSKPKLSKHRRS